MAPSLFRSAARARRLAPRKTLSRRDDGLLPFLDANASAGNGLLLDTCVYIDQLKGRAPTIVEDALGFRTVSHSAVAAQELLHAVWALDPDDPRTGPAIAAIERIIDAMPSHRFFTPDAEVLASAAVYAGILCRV